MTVIQNSSLTLETFLKEPEFCHRNDSLLVLEGINLTLTVEQVFDWLKMNLNR